MPTEERGKIGMIKPSGWQTVKYDNVDGKYLSINVAYWISVIWRKCK